MVQTLTRFEGVVVGGMTFIDTAIMNLPPEQKMIAGFLSLSSILLYLITLIVFLDVNFGVSPFRNGSSIIGEGPFWIGRATLTYFNTGFFTALLSTLSFSLLVKTKVC